jgi:hypothetical protein
LEGNNTLLNDEIKEEIKSFLEVNEIIKDLLETMGHCKAVPRGMFRAIKRTETSQINGLMLYLKLLEKQDLANPKTSRRQEIKLRAEIS